jgi:uncharacterized protein YndB with AHSA1/START domain
VEKIAATIRIDRAAEDVYAYASTFSTMPEWRGGVSEAEQLTDGPVGVGTRIRGGGKVLGRPIGIVIEVTALEPGSRFAYRGTAGLLRTHNIVTFESVAGGTQVTWTDDVELRGILGLLEPLMGRMVRRGYEADLGRLKAILEAPPAKGA